MTTQAAYKITKTKPYKNATTVVQFRSLTDARCLEKIVKDVNVPATLKMVCRSKSRSVPKETGSKSHRTVLHMCQDNVESKALTRECSGVR